MTWFRGWDPEAGIWSHPPTMICWMNLGGSLSSPQAGSLFTRQIYLTKPSRLWRELVYEDEDHDI